MKPREYQQRAIDRVLELFEALVRRVLFVLPTGGGKTVFAAALIKIFLARGQRVLMLAHRRELIKQAFCKLVRSGVSPADIGVIMAGTSHRVVDGAAPPPEQLDDDELWRLYARRRPGAPVQVGSIDTFRNKIPPPADLVVVDEAHRALAKSYCDVQVAYPEAFFVGLTATPVRADGKGLRDAFDEMIVVSTFMELVELGFLVEPLCYGVSAAKRVDLRGVKKSGGDFKADDLAKVVNRGELVGDLVEHYLERGEGMPALAFGVNVEHSKHIAQRFNAAGIPARHVDGNTDTTERDAAIRALRAGEVKVLCNCNVFSEGTDIPEVKVIILGRPTLSLALFLQQCGRGSRPFEGLPFIVLDHAGSCSSFGLPQWDQEWSLDGRKKRETATVRLPPTKDCPDCFAMVAPATRVCPGCGHVFAEPEASTPEESDGKLVLLNKKPPKPPKPELTEKQLKDVAHWNELVDDWRLQNAQRHADGLQWLPGSKVLTAWRQQTGRTWQPFGSTVPKLTLEQLEENKLLPMYPAASLPKGTQLAIGAATLGNSAAAIESVPRLKPRVDVWETL